MTVVRAKPALLTAWLRWGAVRLYVNGRLKSTVKYDTAGPWPAKYEAPKEHLWLKR